jgi:hypothetical protein
VFGRTSGTEQLHCSNSGETFCVAIAVSRADSIAIAATVVPTVLSQTNPVDLPLPKYLRYVRILFFKSKTIYHVQLSHSETKFCR